MNVWQLLDTIVIGWAPLTVDGTFTLDETVTRIRSLSNVSDPDASFPLNVVVENRQVIVYYEPSPTAVASGPYHASIVGVFRPIFRGSLSADGGTRLTGAFGAGWIVRWVGIAAIVLVIFMTLGSVAPGLARLGFWFWGVPVAFIGACIATRVNGADDIRLITNNLIYALQGDA